MMDFTKKPLNLPAKSAFVEAQYERINRAFDFHGKLISTIDFRRLGVIHPSGRIKEMKEKHGYNILKVDQRTVYDEQGFPHPRIAFYELIERPKSYASNVAEGQ